MKSVVSLTLLALFNLGGVASAQNAVTVIKDGFGPVFFLRFSPDGRELARVCFFGPAMLFDTGSYRKARTFPVSLRMVAYNPDGTRIATAEGTDGARVWDSALQGSPIPNTIYDELHQLDTPLQVLQAPSRDHSLRVFWTEFSPDGKLLITTHADGDLSGVFWLSYDKSPADKQWTDHDIGGALGLKYDRFEMIDLDGDGDLDLMSCEERDQLGVFWYENPTK